MLLNVEAIRAYQADGYVLLPSLFAEAEVRALSDEVQRLAELDTPGRVVEKDGRTVRALHGCHLTSERFRALTRMPRLLAPVRQLLGEAVYVYQFKINFKAAFGGDVWQWHQDYIYWRHEDGMPGPHVVNVGIFLDEVTEFNGPLMFVRGSHRRGLIETAQIDRALRAAAFARFAEED